MHIHISPLPGEDTEIPHRKALSAPDSSCSLSFSGGLASRLLGLEAVNCEPNSQLAGNLCSLSRVKSSVLYDLLCSTLPSQVF